MKRSFYEMLEVSRQATQEQIDAAFQSLTQKLEKTTSVRGTAEAMTELNMIREGYNILSNPEKRAVYDAKLYANEKGIDLIFFPKDDKAVKKLGINTVIFATLACVFTYMMYQKLTRETSAGRVDQSVEISKSKAAPPAAETPKAEIAKAEAVTAEGPGVEAPKAPAPVAASDIRPAQK